jgi:hypothetical protein
MEWTETVSNGADKAEEGKNASKSLHIYIYIYRERERERERESKLGG